VAWLALLLVIFVPLERLFPRHRQPVFRRRFGIDVGYFFLTNLGPKLLLVIPLSLMARATHHFLPSTIYAMAAQLPFWIRVALGLLAGEVGAYWGHRWSHESAFLWRFHSTHHDPEEMDWLVHSRAHPLDVVFTRLCGYLPVYLLGLAQPTAERTDLAPLVLAMITTLWGFLIHSNLNLRLGWLEQLVATPAFHHWHHTNDGPAVMNKNYASLFPWVDRCFGTFHLPKHAWPEKYGFLEIALDPAPATAHPTENITPANA
jgi:sterol desaturase/sphingolipid hydroxylase (fatty acid hydroxylase superfamily)